MNKSLTVGVTHRPTQYGGNAQKTVKTYPGATNVNLMFSSLSSSAIDLTKPTHACFVAQYRGLEKVPM